MITLLHGSDAYRIREAVDALIVSHRSEYGSGPMTFDLAIADDVDRFQQAAAIPSFLGERRLLVARNPLAAAETATFLRDCGLGDVGDTHVLLIQQTGTKLPVGQARELSGLERLATTAQQYEPLAGAHADSWVRQFCEQRGHTIRTEAVREVLQRTGADSWALANELEKLCAYTDADITQEAVRILVAQPPTSDQWELSNTLAGRDKRGALAALWRKVQEGTAEPLLLGAIAASLRTLLIIRDLSERGRPTAAIAKDAGLHPFVVSKNLQGARAYDPVSLRSAHAAMAVLDRHTKTGQANTVDGLFSILLTL